MKCLSTILMASLIVFSVPVNATGGHYAGSHGSSHKGGHYRNAATGNHYIKHK